MLRLSEPGVRQAHLSGLENAVAERLLQPERVEEVLASVLDRRQEQASRRREPIAELNKRASEAGKRLKRFCDAIESGVADLSNRDLKDRIAGIQALRDQSRADAMRATAMLGASSQ